MFICIVTDSAFNYFPFISKLYKNDNVSNFVYYEKTRMLETF